MTNGEFGIYIILTQTGTALSRTLKAVTGEPYNHASLSLRGDLARMYSFGRLNPYNPFVGGFVVESPHFGTFKRFARTECLVLYKPITEEQYRAVKQYLRDMYAQKERYGYNHMGLVMAGFRVVHKSRHERLYCSEFVRDVLVRFGIEDAARFPDIVKPMDLLATRGTRVIFRGRLCDYRVSALRELLKEKNSSLLVK